MHVYLVNLNFPYPIYSNHVISQITICDMLFRDCLTFGLITVASLKHHAPHILLLMSLSTLFHTEGQ